MNLKNEYISENRPRNHFMITVPHHTLLYSTKTITSSPSEQLIKHSSYPVPMFSINHQKEIRDPGLVTILKKKVYERKMHVMKRRLARQKALKEGCISHDMVKYVEMSELDPASNVSSEFDWHFSGGNLESLDVDAKQYLIQSSMCGEYSMRMIKSTSRLKHIELRATTKRLLKNYGYEIMKSEEIVGVRYNKSVNFLRRKDITNEVKNIQTPIEFAWNKEIAASTLSHNNLMFIDVDNNLVQSNVDWLVAESLVKLQNETPKHQFPISINSLNEHVITYSNLKSVSIVDLREGKPNKIFDEKNFLFKCEEISYHKNSLHDNLLYIASSHLLYGIDLRKSNDLLMHWNHQLVQQPNILKQAMYDNVEVICLSSNMPGDLKIFNCGKGVEENSWKVNWVPFKPNHISQSFFKIREKGMLLLSDPIKHRVALSTTGVAMISDEKKSKIKLFTQNSLGDIFKCSLLLNEESNEKETKLFGNFNKWDKALEVERDPLKFVPVKERLENGELIFDHIVRLKGLSKVMRCEKLQEAGEDDELEDSEVRSMKIPRWKVDLETVKEYRDALSQHILSDWDLKIEDTQPQLFAKALKEESRKKEKIDDKVSRWLGTTSVDGNADDTKIEAVMEDKIADDPVNIKLEGEQTVDQGLLFSQQQVFTQQTVNSKKPNKVSQRHKGF